MSALAVVTPWYAARSTAGRSGSAREIALRLGARGHETEVLTTCCRSFSDDWRRIITRPAHPSKTVSPSAASPSTRRDPAAFEAANAHLLAAGPEALRPGLQTVAREDARAFVEHNINSSPCSNLARRRDAPRLPVHPYLYGPTLRGLPLVATAPSSSRACTRKLTRTCPPSPRSAASAASSQLRRRARAGAATLRPRNTRARIVRRRRRRDSRASGRRGDACVARRPPRRALRPLLGRRDPAKNTDLLLRSFRRFQREHPSDDLRLVLAGPGAAESVGGTPARGPGVHDLGVVSEATKAALLGRALALFQPSRNESFSRAMMEAWLLEARPVAAHAECLATSIAVERSRGGWLAATNEVGRTVRRGRRARPEELATRRARPRLRARTRRLGQSYRPLRAVLSELA